MEIETIAIEGRVAVAVVRFLHISFYGWYLRIFGSKLYMFPHILGTIRWNLFLELGFFQAVNGWLFFVLVLSTNSFFYLVLL